MSSRFRFFYLAYLSKPISDRLVYRAIPRRRILKIVELGVGAGQRAVRMIEAASFYAPVEQVCYTGVDLFEARSGSDGPGLSLKAAYRLLQATGARIRLLPGDPHSGLARVANSLTATDLVIVSADQDRGALAEAWFYLPRMLHPGSLVFQEEIQQGTVELRPIPRDQIDQWAAARVRHAAQGLVAAIRECGEAVAALPRASSLLWRPQRTRKPL